MNRCHNTDARRPGLHANMAFYATPDGLTGTRPQQSAVTKLTVDLLLCQRGQTLRFGYVLMMKDGKLASDERALFSFSPFSDVTWCVPLHLLHVEL